MNSLVASSPFPSVYIFRWIALITTRPGRRSFWKRLLASNWHQFTFCATFWSIWVMMSSSVEPTNQQPNAERRQRCWQLPQLTRGQPQRIKARATALCVHCQHTHTHTHAWNCGKSVSCKNMYVVGDGCVGKWQWKKLIVNWQRNQWTDVRISTLCEMWSTRIGFTFVLAGTSCT